jgi:hypothetical protein
MYGVIHADGSGEVDPSVEILSALYDELLSTDDEHPDVSLEHEETGWCISAYRNGRVILSSLRGERRHMHGVSKERVILLWRQLIDRDFEGLLKEPWKPGIGDPI